MDYTHHSDSELVRAAHLADQSIISSGERRTAIADEQARRRNAKPAIGTIYKHRYSWGDRGHWVATAYEGAAVTMLYFDGSTLAGGVGHTSAWLPGQIKSNLIEQTLTDKES